MTKNDHNATTAEFKRAQDGASVLFYTADDVKALMESIRPPLLTP
jgi:hypothetical protein